MDTGARWCFLTLLFRKNVMHIDGGNEGSAIRGAARRGSGGGVSQGPVRAEGGRGVARGGGASRRRRLVL